MAFRKYEPDNTRPRGAYVSIRSQGQLAVSSEAVKQAEIENDETIDILVDSDEEPKILVVKVDPEGKFTVKLGKDGGLMFHVPKLIEGEGLRRGNWGAVCEVGEVMVALTEEGESGGEEKPKRKITRKPTVPTGWVKAEGEAETGTLAM